MDEPITMVPIDFIRPPVDTQREYFQRRIRAVMMVSPENFNPRWLTDGRWRYTRDEQSEIAHLDWKDILE